MYALQVYEGRVRNASLAAVVHDERVDTFEVYESRVSDASLKAPAHVECTDALQVNKVSVNEVTPIKHIRCARLGEARSPRCETSLDLRLKIKPRRPRDRLTHFAAHETQRICFRRRKESQNAFANAVWTC
jgi:hypothetical protein